MHLFSVYNYTQTIVLFRFNSVATSFMVKFMTTICSKEGVDADKSVLEAIANASGGDLRCAVNTLQFKFTPGR